MPLWFYSVILLVPLVPALEDLRLALVPLFAYQGTREVQPDVNYPSCPQTVTRKSQDDQARTWSHYVCIMSSCQSAGHEGWSLSAEHQPVEVLCHSASVVLVKCEFDVYLRLHEVLRPCHSILVSVGSGGVRNDMAHNHDDGVPGQSSQKVDGNDDWLRGCGTRCGVDVRKAKVQAE
ncbi:hypothetical protein OH76DRAFT_1407627 [Lentinus brumalis]|uniref:Secreted protein n=1 Tax=Lentinus brumalis TaxID=2498619 RepID=A0A371CZY0_9APHY|nr:hypothetical protein OH76DRAFT_1407627 [Polyporus brumalis]